MKSHQLAVGAGEVEQETQIKWEVRAGVSGKHMDPSPLLGQADAGFGGGGVGQRSKEFSQLCVHGSGSRPTRRRTVGKASSGPRQVG